MRERYVECVDGKIYEFKNNGWFMEALTMGEEVEWFEAYKRSYEAINIFNHRRWLKGMRQVVENMDN